MPGWPRGTGGMVTLRKPWPVGLLVLALATYVVMWVGWATPWSWVVSADEAALAATHRFGLLHPSWITMWNVLCTAFAPLVIRVLTLGVIGWALIRGQRRAALFLFVSVELSAVVTEVAKALANRPRPVTALVKADSTSFPSGHALGTMVAVLGQKVCYTGDKMTWQQARNSSYKAGPDKQQAEDFVAAIKTQIEAASATAPQ